MQGVPEFERRRRGQLGELVSSVDIISRNVKGTQSKRLKVAGGAMAFVLVRIMPNCQCNLLAVNQVMKVDCYWVDISCNWCETAGLKRRP